MSKQIKLTLDIGANFSEAIALQTTQTGRTHRADIRETIGSTTVKVAFRTSPDTGQGLITLTGDTVTLTAGADITELLSLDSDAALWEIDIESVGATAADVRREARGQVLVTRDITRLTEPTAAANASKLLTYSLNDGQTLTTPEQTALQTKIGVSGGGFSGAYADLTGKPTLGTASPLDVAASGDASSAQVVKGNDSRLSDSRAPTSHTHALSDITQSSATSGQVPQWSGSAWVPATPSGGGGGMAIGGAVSGATAGQNLYVNASGNLANRAQVSSGTASPAAALDIVDPTVVISNTLPTGQAVARWENGAADGFASTLELVHSYHPTQYFDSWSFVCKSGYNNLPNYPRLTSSFSFGAQSGVGQFSLKTMGLIFIDSGITLNETTFPAAGTLRMNLPASQYFYIYDTVVGRDIRFSAAGFFVSRYAGRANLEAHDCVIARGADAAKVPFTAQAFASQTADVAQFTDSGGAAMAGVTAKGGIYPASKTVTELASITATAGVMYFCSNESGGAVPVFGDGTNWRRVTDRAIAS